MPKDNEYPRMVYHEDGSNRVVNSEQEENELGGEWGREPTEASNAAQAATPARVDPSGHEPLVRLLIERMKEAFPSLAGDTTNDEPAPAPVKRGPGRPPKNPEPDVAPVNTLTGPATLPEPPVTVKKD